MTQRLWETLLSRCQNLYSDLTAHLFSRVFFFLRLQALSHPYSSFRANFNAPIRDAFIVLQLNQSDKALLPGFPVLFSFVAMRNRDELWSRECKHGVAQYLQYNKFLRA